MLTQLRTTIFKFYFNTRKEQIILFCDAFFVNNEKNFQHFTSICHNFVYARKFGVHWNANEVYRKLQSNICIINDVIKSMFEK